MELVRRAGWRASKQVAAEVLTQEQDHVSAASLAACRCQPRRPSEKEGRMTTDKLAKPTSEIFLKISRGQRFRLPLSVTPTTKNKVAKLAVGSSTSGILSSSLRTVTISHVAATGQRCMTKAESAKVPRTMYSYAEICRTCERAWQSKGREEDD